MFTGEALLLPLHMLIKKRTTCKPEQITQDQASPLVFAIPAAIDVLASSCNFLGLYLLAASTFMMLKMLLLLFLALLSIGVFGRKYDLAQWLSMFIVVSGLVLVALQKSNGEE